ncbi:MAG: DUF6623 family protein [Candidatus Bipolaricaulota bacterium]
MSRSARFIGVVLALALIVLGASSLVVAPPQDAIVTGFVAVWMHGTGMRIEYPDRLSQTLYQAFHARIEGDANTSNWLHFPITTPVVGTFLKAGSGVFSGLETNYRRYRLDKVFVSFRSGSVNARVTNVHVYDGSTQIAAFDNLNLYGEQNMKGFVVPGSPEVEQGICISLGVAFGSSGQRWMELVSVGADLYWSEN